MMPRAKAFISWIPERDGGRERPPDGPTYSTIVRFEDDPEWPSQAWSLVVEFQRVLGGGRYVEATVRFLIDQAPHEQLRQGNHFELYEGDRKVARGVILPSSVNVPDQISEFESALIG